MVIGAALLILVHAFAGVEPRFSRTGIGEIIQITDAAMSTVVIVGAALLFLGTGENRIKRHRALEALHELKLLAHVIDMHQLRKDPAVVLGTPTASSPKRDLSRTELRRYLDYCSEMLSLTGRIAALYAQKFHDPGVVASVNGIEMLTTGLSRKIWQKMMLLEAPV